MEDIHSVILDGYNINLTAQLASTLSVNNVALIFSDEKHIPSGLMLPISGHSTSAEILRKQIECTVPKAKNIWQQIVKAKITCQSEMLDAIQKPSTALKLHIEKVKSGDPDNHEGQAAGKYWRLMVGDDFRRDFDEPGANAMLNYGYAIVRSVIARSLVGTGLHPSLGVHHRNRYNAFALADDAMEPLRPLVDLSVYQYLLHFDAPEELTPHIKKFLVKVLVFPLEFAGNEMSFLDACDRYATSLRQGICENNRKINIPRPLWSQSIGVCGSW